MFHRGVTKKTIEILVYLTHTTLLKVFYLLPYEIYFGISDIVYLYFL